MLGLPATAFSHVMSCHVISRRPRGTGRGKLYPECKPPNGMHQHMDWGQGNAQMSTIKRRTICCQLYVASPVMCNAHHCYSFAAALELHGEARQKTILGLLPRSFGVRLTDEIPLSHLACSLDKPSACLSTWSWMAFEVAAATLSWAERVLARPSLSELNWSYCAAASAASLPPGPLGSF